MGRKKGNVLIVLGLLLLLGAAGLTAYNLNEELSAGRASEAALEGVASSLADAPFQARGERLIKKSAITSEETVELDGRYYMGLITFPTLELQLPVQMEWTYENLKTSPCRMQGSPAMEDLVIMGHNYRTHFGPLDNLRIGDEVSVTMGDGATYVYQVGAKEVVGAYAVEDVTSGAWPLTLFTCTLSGRTRLVVRCDFAE